MDILETKIKGCYLIRYPRFTDERGYFSVPFNSQEFKDTFGLKDEFIQDNQSLSAYGVIRGLHFQKEPYAQTKIVRCVVGSINDVIVDIRPDSLTYLQHIVIPLEGGFNEMVLVPRGCAHGFASLKENTIVEYKVDNGYNKESESGILYNDPTLKINWGINPEDVIISKKDELLNRIHPEIW